MAKAPKAEKASASASTVGAPKHKNALRETRAKEAREGREFFEKGLADLPRELFASDKEHGIFQLVTGLALNGHRNLLFAYLLGCEKPMPPEVVRYIGLILLEEPTATLSATGEARGPVVEPIKTYRGSEATFLEARKAAVEYYRRIGIGDKKALLSKMLERNSESVTRR